MHTIYLFKQGGQYILDLVDYFGGGFIIYSRLGLQMAVFFKFWFDKIITISSYGNR